MKLVGIESGGTRSWGAYGDQKEFHRLDLPADAGCIASTRTDPELESTFNQFFERIALSCIDEDLTIWISAAGYAKSTAQRLSDLARDAANFSGVKGTLYLANDATTLMLLPPRGGSGVVTIIGTGSVVLAAHNGRARKFSGDEWVVSDVGAGIQLGLRGLREAYGKFQGWNTERETGLDEVMRQWIEVEISKHANPLRLPDDVRSMDLDDQIPYAMRSLATFGSHLKALVAGFAPHVLHESTKLDAGAMKILDETTREMAQLIYMQCEWVRNQDPDRYGKRFTVCLDGYIGGSPPYLNRLQAALNLLGNPERPVQIGFDIIGTARFSAAEHETSPHPDPAALDLMPLGAAPPPSFAMAKMIDAGYDGPLDVSPDMDTMVVPLTGE